MSCPLSEIKEIYTAVKVNVKMNEAALKIQRQWRIYENTTLRIRKFRENEIRRLCAAILIQQTWRQRHSDKKEVIVKVSAASQIQKYMKGLTVSKKYEDLRIQMYRRNDAEYFRIMRLRLLTDAQIFLAYLYRKNKKNKNKKKSPKVKKTAEQPGSTGKVSKFIGKNFQS